MKQVQISEDLFMDIIRYHLLEETDLSKKIEKELEDKMETMVRRELYTKYKMAAIEEEREKARQEYLNRKGIMRDFQLIINLTNMLS